jgi:hypothetical protein
MAAVTAERILEIKEPRNPILFPVASGDTIYGGAAACIVKEGYLENFTTQYDEARMIVWVADKTNNVGGPAATTGAGSISGSLEVGSAPAGDKTVRLCYTHGVIRCTFTAIAQSDVGKVVYLANNNTADESQSAGKKFGTLVTYISATEGWVDLNKYYNSDGTILARGAMTAATTTTGGDSISWANPTGEVILVEDIIIDVTTQATGAATMDVGVAADGTTTSDTLIDGIDVGSAAIVGSAITDGGSSGQANRKMTSSQYITGTPSATLAGLVGTYGIKYRIWE